MNKVWAGALLGFLVAGAAHADDSGPDVWTARCKGCHGPDGKAHTKIGQKEKIDDFTTDDWQKEMTDDQVKKIILEGSAKKGSKMKPFKDKLTPGEVDAVIAFIRQMKGK